MFVILLVHWSVDTWCRYFYLL